MLRGPLRLAEAFAVLPLARSRLRSARLPFEDPRVIGAMAVSTAASDLLRKTRAASVGRELAVAALGALPALTALRDRDLAAYHGVEHKAIGGYETGTDPAEVPKEHERCGSNLIAPMVALSVAGQVLVDRLAPKPGPMPRAVAALAVARRRRRALRLRRAQPRLAGRPRRPRPRPRDPAPGLHPRADARAARGRPGGARRNPTGGGR